MRLLSASLALRFLRSKKSHGAVGAVAGVSIAGVAVATAAIVCVLSVFNGFKEVLTEKLDTLTPDVTVTALTGKTISDGDSLAAALSALPGVAQALPVVEDQALTIFEGAEMPVSLKGVDMDAYRKMTGIDSLYIMPAVAAANDATPGIAAVGTVAGLGNPLPGESVMVFAPRRYGRVNMANPLSSFVTDSVALTAVYEAKQTDFDKNTLIVPIETARDMFQYDAEATSVIVRGKPGVGEEALTAQVAEATGGRFRVIDRLESHQENFRMVNIEKWVTYLLLFFIVIIAGFNIISTLSMLVLEKQRQMKTLRALGLTSARIGRVFAWESFFVAFAGGAIGIVAGLTLCLIQQHFGLIKLGGDPGTLIMASYPVKVVARDLIPTMVPILLTATVTALSASGFARRRATV